MRQRKEIQEMLREGCVLKMSGIESVVFDLGGVLIDWNPRYLFRKLTSDEDRIETFIRDICNQHWNEGRDAGLTFADGIAELVARYPDQEDWIRVYFDRWAEMLAGDIRGTVEILEEIHRAGRHRLFALSNWSAETFPYAEKRFPFLGLFQKILVSGHEKLIKPDPHFFGLLAERHEVDFRRAVFIDDVEKNVAAAQSLGFHAIRFTDPETLRLQLRSLGVLT